MKAKSYIFSIISTIIILGVNSSFAQSSDDFNPYTNKQMNFSIQYPSNWRVVDLSKVSPDVSFRPERVYGTDDERKFETGFGISMLPVEPYLDTDTMTIKNVSLDQRFQAELNSIQSDYEKRLVRQNKVTVGGNPGWKVEYTNQPTYYPYYSFDIFTFANGKFYRLSYTDEQLRVPKTLPLINKMVESFQVGVK